MLDEDPKSVCIQSNELKAHLSTMQNLVTDNNHSEEDIDWEFWTALIDDFGAVATKLPHLLSAKLKAGIPSKLRGVIWQVCVFPSFPNINTDLCNQLGNVSECILTSGNSLWSIGS